MKHCDDIKLLLPWLVNGTLEPDEKYQVLSHLSCCSECRGELADVISIYNAVVSRNTLIDNDMRENIFTSITSQINKNSSYENNEQKIVSDMLQNLGEVPLFTLIFKPANDEILAVLDRNLQETKDAIATVLNQVKATCSLYIKLIHALAAQ